MDKMVFLRIDWMKYYKGLNPSDKVTLIGDRENIDRDHEIYNFYPFNGKLYAYFRNKNEENINLQKIDKNCKDSYLNNVTIVFFGKPPQKDKDYIIGFYKKAKLYSSVRSNNSNELGLKLYYYATTDIENGFLIPEENRDFSLPLKKNEKAPGQRNIWYVQQNNPEYFEKVRNYISGF